MRLLLMALVAACQTIPPALVPPVLINATGNDITLVQRDGTGEGKETVVLGPGELVYVGGTEEDKNTSLVVESDGARLYEADRDVLRSARADQLSLEDEAAVVLCLTKAGITETATVPKGRKIDISYC